MKRKFKVLFWKNENLIFHLFKFAYVCQMLALIVLMEMGLVNCQLFNFVEHNIYINP
jgi:hypothetical protein